MHFFQEPVHLSHVSLTEPGGQMVTAIGNYGQNIGNGYSYLSRTDGKAFLPGTWRISLEERDLCPLCLRGLVRVAIAYFVDRS